MDKNYISADYHLHSSFSTDSDAPMEQMVTRAISLGLKEICFTEHMDHCYPERYRPFFPGVDLLFEADPVQVHAKITELQNKYEGEILIRFGMELGMRPQFAEYYRDLARSMPFDFLIASQHLTGDYDPYYPETWEGKTADALIRSYYEEMLGNLRSMDDSSWDTLAHLDYIIRYIPVRKESGLVFDSLAAFPDLIDEILREVIRRGKCLEVNTAGIKYGLGQTHPGRNVLARYYELGGRNLTIGSDSHDPDHIAIAFPETADMLRSLGFTSYCTFLCRDRHTNPL